MTKRSRQAAIVEIIKRSPVLSQRELAAQLRRRGISVAQPTLSRDLQELGAVKTRSGYEIIERNNEPNEAELHLRRLARELLSSVEASGNILVLKTGPGNAQSLALALDRAGWHEILGTVAGDDTIFAVLKNTALAGRVVGRLRAMLS